MLTSPRKVSESAQAAVRRSSSELDPDVERGPLFQQRDRARRQGALGVVAINQDDVGLPGADAAAAIVFGRRRHEAEPDVAQPRIVHVLDQIHRRGASGLHRDLRIRRPMLRAGQSDSRGAKTVILR